MQACTKNCRKNGHLEFSVHWDPPALQSNLEVFLGWLEHQVSCGEKFLPEQTIQFGWSILQIRQRTDGTLGVFEADFKGQPIIYIDSVSNTLWHAFVQKSVAESLGLSDELELSSFLFGAIVCNRFGSGDGFIASRIPSKGTDSGWFFGCDDQDHDHQLPGNLRRVSLYEAAVRYNQQIIPFLGLPKDTFVGFNDTCPYFSRGETELEVKPGSYLAMKYFGPTGQ